MFNWLYKLVDIVFLRKPSVQFFPPKALNVYFANAKNPQVKLINLTQLVSVDFQVIAQKTEAETLYALVALYNGDKERIVELAQFETRAEAENALRTVKVKMVSPTKSLVKWLSFFIFLLAATSVFLDIYRTIARPVYRPAVMSAPASVNGVNMNGINMSEQELENLRKQYEQLTGQPAPNVTPQNPMTQPATPQQPVEQPKSPGNQLLDRLGN